jgi:5-methylcytosine-specific restriction enzyme A
MPTLPARPCGVPGCPRRAVGQGRCQVHQRPEAPRPSPSVRGYGAEWQRIRTAFLRAYPLCCECGERATDVDHRVARVQGGTDDWDNLQPLCHRHHSQKTARENGGFGNQRRG